MKDLVGSALLVSGDLRRRGGLGAPILQEESDTSKIFHLKKDWLRFCQDFLPSDKYGPGLILRVLREGELEGQQGLQSSWWVLSQRIKIVVTLMTRWDWKLTGNDSKASQLSRLKDKNQFWIHCDERRVDAGVIVALAPLFHVFNQPKQIFPFEYVNDMMQMQIEMKQKTQFDILKILTSCWLGWVVVSPFWQGDTGRSEMSTCSPAI